MKTIEKIFPIRNGKIISINSISDAKKWIKCEWAEKFDGKWGLAGNDGFYPATGRQSKFLDKAEEQR